MSRRNPRQVREFPFLFGGTFIEGQNLCYPPTRAPPDFPSFSEGLSLRARRWRRARVVLVHFPSFSEGLSLRAVAGDVDHSASFISLPFRRDFH